MKPVKKDRNFYVMNRAQKESFDRLTVVGIGRSIEWDTPHGLSKGVFQPHSSSTGWAYKMGQYEVEVEDLYAQLKSVGLEFKLSEILTPEDCIHR